jgi:hypothetical protein
VAHGLRLAGAALVLIGVVVGGLGLRSWPARVRPAGAATVNADRPGIDAHNSPAVALDPGRPLVVAVADRIDTPRFSCSLHLSKTGGETWAPLPLPRPPEAPNCYWPDVAFDGDGRLLVLYTATGGRYNQPVGVWLQRYEGDAPAGSPVRVAGTEAFHAHLAVDGRRVLVAWVQTPPQNAERPLGFEPGPNPLMLARSEDGGATFSAPVVVESSRRVVQPSVLIGSGGTVTVGALDMADDAFNYEARHEGQGGPPPEGFWRVVAWRSSDGGATFGPATVVADRLDIPERVIVDLMPGPSFARDPRSGALYAAWDAGQGAARDVFLARSGDGGTAWGPPVRLEPGGGSQFLPGVGVAPGGRVDLVFYDRSKDPNDVMAEVVVASSWVGGRTVTGAVASEKPFDSRIGLASSQGLPQLGNQLAVASRADGFLALWADTTAGTQATNLQDLAVASVAASPAEGRRWPLVGLGAALVLAGAALFVRRRPRSAAA